MINSAVNVLVPEEASLMPNDSTILSSAINKNKKDCEVATRFKCMQSWFLRCSRIEKFRFLKNMLYSIKSTSSLALILNTLVSCSGKSMAYSMTNTTNFVYDKGIHDHSRSLNLVTLKAVQAKELEWFQTIIDDSDQVMIFIGLIRLGGGLLMYQIYHEAVKLFENLQTLVLYLQQNQIIDKVSPSSREKSSSLIVDDVQDVDEPYFIEVQTHKQIWEELFANYKKHVEKSVVGDYEKHKSKKTNASKKADDLNHLDYMQLLPIHVVYKIFRCLDNSTLKKIQKVNNFWQYASKNFISQQDEKKKIEKIIAGMMTGLGKNIIEEEDVEQQFDDPYDKRCVKERLTKLWQRGACIRKLTKPASMSTMHLLLDSVEWNHVQNVALFPKNPSTHLTSNRYSEDYLKNKQTTNHQNITITGSAKK